MGEDVVHNILALCIVVQKYGGQPIHLTVMLSKQLFEFTLICHTLLIHTKTDLLNPLWQFFCAKLGKTYEKAPDMTENRMPGTQAKRIMDTNPGQSVKETAYELGFPGTANFCRYFKRATGIYPQAYKKNGHG